ncbi:hypothetical protein EOM09_00295 [bacterium]|nr:hypothetical protein [bacterium]
MIKKIFNLFIILFFLFFSKDVYGKIIEEVLFKPQVLPGSWEKTLNCGQTSVTIANAYYNNLSISEEDIKNIDTWLNNKFSDPIRDFNGYYTNTNKLKILCSDYFDMDFCVINSGENLFDFLKKQIDIGNLSIVQVRVKMKLTKVPHFMVFLGYDDDFVYFHDPGQTKGDYVKFEIKDFLEVWENQNFNYLLFEKNKIENKKEVEIVEDKNINILKIKEVNAKDLNNSEILNISESQNFLELENNIQENINSGNKENLKNDEVFENDIEIKEINESSNIKSSINSEIEENILVDNISFEEEYGYVNDNNILVLGPNLKIDLNPHIAKPVLIIDQESDKNEEFNENGEIENIFDENDILNEEIDETQETEAENINEEENIVNQDENNENENIEENTDDEENDNDELNEEEENIEEDPIIENEDYSETSSLFGELNSDIILTSDIPYIINGEFVIPSGKKITIMSGAIILFGISGAIVVEGEMEVLGTENDIVLFTTSNTENPVENSWKWIEIRNRGIASFNWTIIEYGGYDYFSGQKRAPIIVQGSFLNANNLYINHIDSDCIKSYSSYINIKNSSFKNCKYALDISNSEGIVENSIFNNNFNAFVMDRSFENLILKNNSISNSLDYSIKLINSVPTIIDMKYINNKYDEIFLDLELDFGDYLLSPGNYYVLKINLFERTNFTISPGSVFKSYNSSYYSGSWYVRSNIFNAIGTTDNPIIFDSYYENPKLEQKWGKLNFYNNNFLNVENVIVKNGGRNYFLGQEGFPIYLENIKNINAKNIYLYNDFENDYFYKNNLEEYNYNLENIYINDEEI